MRLTNLQVNYILRHPAEYIFFLWTQRVAVNNLLLYRVIYVDLYAIIIYTLTMAMVLPFKISATLWVHYKPLYLFFYLLCFMNQISRYMHLKIWDCFNWISCTEAKDYAYFFICTARNYMILNAKIILFVVDHIDS